MIKKAIWITTLLCLFASLESQRVKAEEPAKSSETSAAGDSSGNGKISLAEVAPELYYQLHRYPKFYGEPNTIHGDFLERSYLLGRVGGARDFLVDHGIYFDVSVTQFLQSNVSGGKNHGSVRYNGT